MILPLEDRIILANHKGQPVPPNIKETDSSTKCCIKCLDCDDEVLTICLKYKFITEWEFVCDEFRRSR
jgi:hypothetical protein